MNDLCKHRTITTLSTSLSAVVSYCIFELLFSYSATQSQEWNQTQFSSVQTAAVLFTYCIPPSGCDSATGVLISRFSDLCRDWLLYSSTAFTMCWYHLQNTRTQHSCPAAQNQLNGTVLPCVFITFPVSYPAAHTLQPVSCQSSTWSTY